MSAPWLRETDPTGYRTLSVEQQEWRERLARRRIAQRREAAAASAAVAWTLRHSARPDLLVDALKEARRG